MEVSGYNLSWRTFSSHLAEVSRELYQEKYFSDVTLLSEDLIAVEAHRMVLSAASPVLRNVLRINPTVRTQLFLKGIKHQQLDSVLKFIYHGEVQVPSREINNFLKAGVCTHEKVGSKCRYLHLTSKGRRGGWSGVCIYGA